MSKTVFHNPACMAMDPDGPHRLLTKAEMLATRNPKLAVPLLWALSPQIWLESSVAWRSVGTDALPLREAATYRTTASIDVLENLIPKEATLVDVVKAYQETVKANQAFVTVMDRFLAAQPLEVQKQLEEALQ